MESNDGEADYYLLDCTWTISQIYRRFGKLRVLLFADIDDDMDTDMKEMLSALQNMTFHVIGKQERITDTEKEGSI